MSYCTYLIATIQDRSIAVTYSEEQHAPPVLVAEAGLQMYVCMLNDSDCHSVRIYA